MDEKKIKRAVTDSGDKIIYDIENKPGLANLLTIYSGLSCKTFEDIEKQFEGKLYGHLKVELAKMVCDKIQTIQKKYYDLMNNKDYLTNILKTKTKKAKIKARNTLDKVYDKIGFLLP